LPGLVSRDLYLGAGDAKDPLVDDGPGPLLIAMLAFADAHALDAAIADGAFGAPLSRLPDGVRAAGAAMECRHYPVAGAAAPADLRAPFSYVVRYHRPAENAAAFIANYVATHPPTLARLPGIRNIMCYFPLDLPNPPGLAKADYMLGNEVVFDDVAAFNRAMASPVHQELRAHFHAFPPFSGANTHFPMLRTRLVGPIAHDVSAEIITVGRNRRAAPYCAACVGRRNTAFGLLRPTRSNKSGSTRPDGRRPGSRARRPAGRRRR
jgi:hypothetical protein